MITNPERQKIIVWINESIEAGATKSRACRTLGISIRTIQRWSGVDGEVLFDQRPNATRVSPANKLTQQERDKIKQVCLSDEFADMPPSRIVPMLADRGEYIASESSFYRVLNAESLLIQRGRAKRKGTYNKPTSFTASQSNQVWSWDITHLPSHVAGQRFYLYMIEDIYNRKIVGADVYDSETGELASALLQRITRLEKISSAGLVLHSDNGSPMKSFTMRAKMYDLGIIASHSRPRVSNDNPYSESLFRTLKYCPSWPKHGFATIAEARKWVGRFVAWYNCEHRHSKIKFVTPNQRHYGLDTEILQKRKELYELKKSENGSRWSGSTRNWEPITEVHLNPEKINQAA
jgi:putative transposase